jgi:hypothetical protein
MGVNLQTDFTVKMYFQCQISAVHILAPQLLDSPDHPLQVLDKLLLPCTAL